MHQPFDFRMVDYRRQIMHNRHKGRVFHEESVRLPVEGMALLVIQFYAALSSIVDLRVFIIAAGNCSVLYLECTTL